MAWSKTIVTWTEEKTAFVSAVFSWDAQMAYQLCVYYRRLGYHVRCGGPAVFQNPEMFSDFDTSGTVDALPHHNPDATFTSRGCPRKCSFCLVPKLEGDLVELDDWPVRPIICDNNLLATSQAHFDRVIDRLLEKKIQGIDFNQGLDSRLLTAHHAARLAELPKDTIVRLAWDNVATEKLYLSSIDLLKTAGIKLRQIKTYVLIGYKDTPEDARYRLEKIKSLGMRPNPMRYQPINTPVKNSYIGEHWTHELLVKYMRYWANLRFTEGFSFDEFDPRRRAERNQVVKSNKLQPPLFNLEEK